MHLQDKEHGVSARFTHVCGHSDHRFFYAAASFAEADRSRQEANVCLTCRNEIALQEARCRDERARMEPRREEHYLYPVNPDPALPQPNDYYGNGKEKIRVERDSVGQYWLRRVPDPGIVYQTWVRDQVALQEFLTQRAFKRLPAVYH